MRTDLFYCTGTGNSLWIARTLANGLGDARVSPMRPARGEVVGSGADAVGIVFPVHIWGLPQRVIAFVETLPRDPARYHFAVAVNAGQVAATLIQLERLMRKRGMALSAGFEIAMPSNYIPWGGPGTPERQRQRFDRAAGKIGRIVAAVAGREKRPVEKGPRWQNVLFTWLYRLSFPRVPRMDGSFWVDQKCNACGVCTAICPSGNIAHDGERPRWLHRCEQCLACIQWCPHEAIQFGKKTPQYERYHHPEVTLQEMLAAAAPPEGDG
ncbi:MAG: EFR1 family ferrodoxin [Syntrophales bacterium]